MKATLRSVTPADEASREFVTVRDWIRHASSRFAAAGLCYGHGTDNAWDEAAWLVLWSLHQPLDILDPVLDATISGTERAFLSRLIERRCSERVPAAYLTGEAWLRGHRFLSDERALVPRSLIAEALEDALPHWLPAEEPATVLDLCTGGASIAILAALRFPSARVDASDLSTDALALAAENVALYGLEARVELHQGDRFESLDGRRYDLILCNPPYVCEASMQALPDEFRAEPQGALAGGDDGMDLVRQILSDAPVHLSPDGVLLLEIGHEAEHFEAAFPTLEFAYLPVTAGDTELVLVTRTQLERLAQR